MYYIYTIEYYFKKLCKWIHRYWIANGIRFALWYTLDHLTCTVQLSYIFIQLHSITCVCTSNKYIVLCEFRRPFINYVFNRNFQFINEPTDSR